MMPVREVRQQVLFRRAPRVSSPFAFLGLAVGALALTATPAAAACDAVLEASCEHPAPAELLLDDPSTAGIAVEEAGASLPLVSRAETSAPEVDRWPAGTDEHKPHGPSSVLPLPPPDHVPADPTVTDQPQALPVVSEPHTADRRTPDIEPEGPTYAFSTGGVTTSPGDTPPDSASDSSISDESIRTYSRVEALQVLIPALPTSPTTGASDEPAAPSEHDRAVAGRLVLATDALAELGAFGRDEDPYVNRAVTEVARSVPDGGLDDAGYRAELAVLAAELPSLIDALSADVVSTELVELTTLLGPETLQRLDAGDMAFLEPLPWLDAISDLLRRGGAPRRDDSDAAVLADEKALFEFVRRFADPGLFPTESAGDQPATTVPASANALVSGPAPDLPLIDEPAETSTNTGLLSLVGGLVAGLTALLLLGYHLATRQIESEQRTGAGSRSPQPGPSTAMAGSALDPITGTPPNGAATGVGATRNGKRLDVHEPEEPGSLIELLDASRRMTASLDVAEIAEIAIAEARAIVDAEGGLLIRRTDTALVPIASDPAPLFAADSLENSVLRRVVDTGRTVSAVTTDDSALIEVPVAMASVGIVANGSVIGALMVVRRPTRHFSPSELDALEMLAPLVGSALLAAQTHGSATALAELDALTGLANRRSLDRDLEALQPAHVASYIMIDVDHFKQFNDTNGHAAGDLALQEVAAAIERHVRGEDRVYRYGGEEFCVLLPGATASEAAHVAERVRSAVESSTVPGEEHQPGGRITISVGVADTTGGVSDIIDRADGALYEAKERGRNQVAVAGSNE